LGKGNQSVCHETCSPAYFTLTPWRTSTQLMWSKACNMSPAQRKIQRISSYSAPELLKGSDILARCSAYLRKHRAMQSAHSWRNNHVPHRSRFATVLLDRSPTLLLCQLQHSPHDRAESMGKILETAGSTRTLSLRCNGDIQGKFDKKKCSIPELGCHEASGICYRIRDSSWLRVEG
jgi:hypothetical protein